MAEELTRRRALRMVAIASGSALVVGSGKAAPRAAGRTGGEYAFDLLDIEGGMIAISSDGTNVLAYVCDGRTTHQPTMEFWLKGPVTDGLVQLSDNNTQVVARLSPDDARGSVRLSDGSLHQFIAPAIAPDISGKGLFRSAQTFNGVPYLGGWIALPEFNGRRLGEQQETPVVEPAAFVVAKPSGFAELAADRPPAPPRGGVLYHPPQSGPVYRPPPALPRTGGCIINQQTGSILPYVAPNFATMKADVPGLGTFELRRCLKTVCA